MTCEELKSKIESGEKLDSFLVLTYPKANGAFLADQYLNAIAKNQNLRMVYIHNIAMALYDAFGLQDDVLYVLKADEFTLPARFDPYDYGKVVVICGKYKGSNDYVVRLPELTQDNIKEYMECLCPGLPPNIINWIYDEAEGNIDRISSEMSKLKEFPEESQEAAFQMAKDSGNFNVTSGLTLGAAVDGIFSMENKDKTLGFLNNLDVTDPKQTAAGGFTAFLLNELRDMLLVQTAKYGSQVVKDMAADAPWRLRKAQARSGRFTLHKHNVVNGNVDDFPFLADKPFV